MRQARRPGLPVLHCLAARPSDGRRRGRNNRAWPSTTGLSTPSSLPASNPGSVFVVGYLPQALLTISRRLDMARLRIGWFADYAAVIAARYGDRVKRFATFNEPSIFTLFGLGIRRGKRATASVEAAAPGNPSHQFWRMAPPSISCASGSRAARSARSTTANRVCRGGRPGRRGGRQRGATPTGMRAFPDPQCLGRYPESIRVKIEPYLRAGNLARINRPVDWFGLNHYSPVFVKAAAGRFRSSDLRSATSRTMCGPLTPIGAPIMPEAFKSDVAAGGEAGQLQTRSTFWKTAWAATK